MPLPDESSQASVQSLKALFEQSCSSPDKQQQHESLPSPVQQTSSPRPLGRVRSSFIAVDKGRAALNFFERSPSPILRTVSMPVMKKKEDTTAGTTTTDGVERLIEGVKGIAVEAATETAVEQTVNVSDEDNYKASMSTEKTLQQVTETVVEPSEARLNKGPAKSSNEVDRKASTTAEKLTEMAVEPLMAQAGNAPGKSNVGSSKKKSTTEKTPQKVKTPSSKTPKATARGSMPTQKPLTSTSPRVQKKKQVDTQSPPSIRSTRSQSSMRSVSPLDPTRPPSASIGRAFGRSGRPATSLAHGSPPPRTASLMATSKDVPKTATPQ
ncbi:hypothetical protein BCR37DRAFT_211545 [Protomyces lactucae-debilis]|uniref:Uncharacterized protein n=1 Tax=Protomyces lactucae-debilis TaxID=2754530 RepID=A0A1Y2FQR8_PROLT|nr:uncharacterized protein BCR37DRAFT_211545 [Protomyces lactucae-debilis]ORY86279.1 hypothetical protein BCR37DRAFT_211545 [Protomyces lactucae-debilis]